MKAQPCLSSDVISSLPADIIETVLCLLPVKEATRTSILSRDWRYKWTKIPKLVFNISDFGLLPEEFVAERYDIVAQRAERRLFHAIHQVLLLHQGPITEFTLMTNEGNCVEYDQTLLHLSRRNTVKKLDLCCCPKLPLCVFWFHELTELSLSNCHCQHQPSLNGFGSLTLLHLWNVSISKNTLLRLLSNSPSLKTFTLVDPYMRISSDDDSTIIELFQCLRMIENLTIGFWGIQCFGQLPHIRELPTTLLRLKYIYLEGMYDFKKDGYGLPFLALLIRSSPNLEKILLKISIPPGYDKFVDYSDIKLEHLIELEIRYFRNLQMELQLVKFILTNSPVLKRVKIFHYGKVTKDEELNLSRLILSFPCASTEAKICVIHRLY